MQRDIISKHIPLQWNTQRDIVTHFSKHAPLQWKKFHESFIILNSVSFRNINFARSYVIFYEKRKGNKKFDMLKHSQVIPYMKFFKCSCGSDRTNFRKSQKRIFHPNLWQYDKRHRDAQCPFRRRYDYFRLLQSVDKTIPMTERLLNINKKGSLMKLKKLYRNLKLDYEIYFWVKNLNSTSTAIYKNESQMLQKFKQTVFRKGKKKPNCHQLEHLDARLKSLNQKSYKMVMKQDSYRLKSPEYHPQSPH